MRSLRIKGRDLPSSQRHFKGLNALIETTFRHLERHGVRQEFHKGPRLKEDKATSLVGVLFALLIHERKLNQHQETTIMHPTPKSSRPAPPILVTSAGGRVGAIGRTIVQLLLKQGKAVRARLRKEDERAQALRHMGAEVVVGNLLDLGSMHRVIAVCEAMYFGRSVSDDCLDATVNAAAVAKTLRREGVHQYAADDALTNEYYRDYAESAAQSALARRAGAELVRSACRKRAADSAATLLWTVAGLRCGAAVFSSGNWLLSRRGAQHRKHCGECVKQRRRAAAR